MGGFFHSFEVSGHQDCLVTSIVHDIFFLDSIERKSFLGELSLKGCNFQQQFNHSLVCHIVTKVMFTNFWLGTAYVFNRDEQRCVSFSQKRGDWQSSAGAVSRSVRLRGSCHTAVNGLCVHTHTNRALCSRLDPNTHSDKVLIQHSQRAFILAHSFLFLSPLFSVFPPSSF